MNYNLVFFFTDGALAQLGARLHGMEEAKGSNPLCSRSYSRKLCNQTFRESFCIFLVSGSPESFFNQNYVLPVIQNKGFGGLRLDKGIPWQRNVLDVLDKAWQTCAQEPAHYDIKVRYTLSIAIALIAEHMISIQTDISPKHLRDSERIKTMLQYTMDNYGEAIDTTAIA